MSITIHEFPPKHPKMLGFTGFSTKYPQLPLCLSGMGIYHLQEPIDRPNGVDYWQWIQSVSGKGELVLNDCSYIVEEGNGILLPAGCGHRYHAISKEWYINFICIDGSALSEIITLLNLTAPGVYQLPDPQVILDYQDQIFEIHKQDPSSSAFETSKLLYPLLLDLSTAMRNPSSQSISPRNEKVHDTICYMQEHFREPIGLEDIASHILLSKEYLCQLFKKNTGRTVLEYLTQLRLAEAKMELVSHPKKSILEIASTSGFETSSYFCYVFKKHEGVTPQQFRENRA